MTSIRSTSEHQSVHKSFYSVAGWAARANFDALAGDGVTAQLCYSSDSDVYFMPLVLFSKYTSIWTDSNPLQRLTLVFKSNGSDEGNRKICLPTNTRCVEFVAVLPSTHTYGSYAFNDQLPSDPKTCGIYQH